MESRNKLTMCRLCLSENECFINIFEMNDWQGFIAAEVISDVLQFKISETDVYPHVVCSTCITKLAEFKLFKEFCQKSKIMYDRMFILSESLVMNQPDVDAGLGCSGLELCEEDPLKGATSDESDHDRSHLELFEQNRLEEASSDVDFVTVKSEAMYCSDNEGNDSKAVIKQEELDISGDEYEEPFEGTNIEEDGSGLQLCQQDPLRNALSEEDGSGLQLCQQDPLRNALSEVQHAHVEAVTHHQYPQFLEHKRPRCTPKEAIDADSFIRNITTEDESGFEKFNNISCIVEVEVLSNGTMKRLEEHSIPLGESMYVQGGVSVTEEGENEGKREEMGTGGEGENKSGAAEKGVEGERKRFKCSYCGKVLKTKGNLTSHMIIHGFGKPYKCEVCGKVFHSKGNLNSHVLTHTGSKPYKCTICSKGFRQCGNLKVHIRTHTGSKPYVCVECSKSFNQSSHLNIHMRTHTGCKPYKCSTCSKSFSTSSHLKRHQNSQFLNRCNV